MGGTLLGERRAGPVDLKERAGDVGDAELIFGEDLFRLGKLVVGEVLEAFAPQAAQLDPMQAEVVGYDGAGVVEVGRDLVVDD